MPTTFHSLSTDGILYRRMDQNRVSGEEMLALFELARGLSGTMSLVNTADVILKHLRRMVASLSALYMNDLDADELLCAHGLGERGDLIKGLVAPAWQRLSGGLPQIDEQSETPIRFLIWAKRRNR